MGDRRPSSAWGRFRGRLSSALKSPAVIGPIGLAGIVWGSLFEWDRLRSSPLWGTSTLWVALLLCVAGWVVGFGLIRLADKARGPWTVLAFAYAAVWMVAFMLTHHKVGDQPVINTLWSATVVTGTMVALVIGAVGCVAMIFVAFRGRRR